MYRFSGVAMQKGFNSSEYVTSYELSYSEDGIVWHDYDDVSFIPSHFHLSYFCAL